MPASRQTLKRSGLLSSLLYTSGDASWPISTPRFSMSLAARYMNDLQAGGAVHTLGEWVVEGMESALFKANTNHPPFLPMHDREL